MSLQNIQSKLNAPKDLYNSFGKYKYRSLEGILAALKPLLEHHGYSLSISDEMIDVGGRVYVKATATLFDSKMAVVVSNTACAREAETKKGMDEAQITGAASSYARKYCLNGLFCIDDTKDADATNTHGKKELPHVDEKLANFKLKVDKCKTEEALDEFMVKALPYAQKTMEPKDFELAKSYVEQIRATL